jgi:hypothetical protein
MNAAVPTGTGGVRDFRLTVWPEPAGCEFSRVGSAPSRPWGYLPPVRYESSRLPGQGQSGLRPRSRAAHGLHASSQDTTRRHAWLLTCAALRDERAGRERTGAVSPWLTRVVRHDVRHELSTLSRHCYPQFEALGSVCGGRHCRECSTPSSVTFKCRSRRGLLVVVVHAVRQHRCAGVCR